MTLSRKQLEKFLNNLLSPYLFKDYGPNGLQIEGTEEIKKIAFAVSATKDSVEKAVAMNADTLIVHHGLFWKFHGVRTITGPFAKRVKPLIENNMNLFGYHLPLDAHMEVGNAAAVATMIGLQDLEPFGDHKGMPTGVKGNFKAPLTVAELEERVEKALNHKCLISDATDGGTISNMGIITGGANSEWFEAYKLGLDSYLTGEMSEHDWHEAKEHGVTMVAAGHHATEKLGIQSLMGNLKKEFQIECEYIDSPNPA